MTDPAPLYRVTVANLTQVGGDWNAAMDRARDWADDTGRTALVVEEVDGRETGNSWTVGPRRVGFGPRNESAGPGRHEASLVSGRSNEQAHSMPDGVGRAER